MNNTQAILTVIREQCGLMELKEIRNDRDLINEIIGSEVQLNHLLKTIDLSVMTGKVGEYSIGVAGHLKLNGKELGIKYDTSKSVEQNLNDNEELRTFIYKLIVK